MGRFRNAETGVVVSTATTPPGAGWEPLDAPDGGTAKPTRRKAPTKRSTAARTAATSATGSTDHDDAASASQRDDD